MHEGGNPYIRHIGDQVWRWLEVFHRLNYLKEICYLNNHFLCQLVRQPKYRKKYWYWHKNYCSKSWNTMSLTSFISLIQSMMKWNIPPLLLNIVPFQFRRIELESWITLFFILLINSSVTIYYYFLKNIFVSSHAYMVYLFVSKFHIWISH